MITEIENDIIARLVAGFAGAGLRPEVIPFPARPETWRSTHPKASVLVAYVATNFGQTMATDVVVQDARLEYDVHVISPSLRHGGAYAYLLAARALLTGYRPADAGMLVPLREKFVGRRDNRWTYALTVECTVPAIQVADEDTAALIRRIIAIDDGSGDVVNHVPQETA